MKRILLIDDDHAVASALAKLLQGAGYAVELAYSAAHGLRCFSEETPDLVLLDLGLPDRDGWDLYEMLALLKPLVPIVVLTARPGQVTMAQAAGIGALVEKPADPEPLLRLIRRLLEEPDFTRLERLVNGRPATRWVRAKPTPPQRAMVARDSFKPHRSP